MYLDYNRADWPGLCMALPKAPLLSDMRNTNDVNAAWCVWYNQFSNLAAQCVPMRIVVVRPKNKI